jgi:DNA repair protein RecN (Recombination protein N)
MIFDEIDTGVSGNASEKLAQKLLAISKNRQVICVSHLSQVASYATNHYYISKAEVGGKTRTSVQLLEGDKRVAEVARLIGGAISSHSIEHAKFMINSGKEFLASLK